MQQSYGLLLRPTGWEPHARSSNSSQWWIWRLSLLLPNGSKLKTISTKTMIHGLYPKVQRTSRQSPKGSPRPSSCKKEPTFSIQKALQKKSSNESNTRTSLKSGGKKHCKKTWILLKPSELDFSETEDFLRFFPSKDRLSLTSCHGDETWASRGKRGFGWRLQSIWKLKELQRNKAFDLQRNCFQRIPNSFDILKWPNPMSELPFEIPWILFLALRIRIKQYSLVHHGWFCMTTRLFGSVRGKSGKKQAFSKAKTMLFFDEFNMN